MFFVLKIAGFYLYLFKQKYPSNSVFVYIRQSIDRSNLFAAYICPYKYLGKVAFVLWFIMYFDYVKKSFGDNKLLIHELL